MAVAGKGMRVVNWGIWRPAARLMQRVRFPGKMALTTVPAALAMLFLLGLFVSAEREDLVFTARERQGAAYAGAVLSAMEASDRWRYEARMAAFGEPGTQADSARQAYEQAHQRIAALQAVHGQDLSTAAAWARVEESAAASRTSTAASAEQVYASMNALAEHLTALLGVVTDHSGLSLDPELDTHHLISLALERLPDVTRRTGELRGLAGTALRAGRAESALFQRLTEARALLAADLDRAQDDLEKIASHRGASIVAVPAAALAETRTYLSTLRQTVPAADAVQGDARAFIEQANKTLGQQYAAMTDGLAKLDGLLAAREQRLMRELWSALAAVAICMVLIVFLAMGFYRAMHGGFKSLRRHLMRVAMGDLREDIDARGRDEISDLMREIAFMQDSLRQTVSQVQEASDTVVQASVEIASGTQDLSTRTEATAAALEESSAALEQTSSSVAHTAESARQASEIAVDNASVAQRGGQVMQDVVKTMERIQHSSRKIHDIIGVIDGIAFQTNILALNAAVEAARAGEQGRGFAVVAGEVRSLAQRSAEAAKEIKGLIAGSVTEVEGGMAVVQSAGKTMNEIVSHADQVRQLLQQVADGTREQSMGIGQVGQAVQDLDRNTQANAALVEETAAAATSQRQAAVRMAAQVDEFRLPGHGKHAASMVEGIDVDSIIDAHRQWKVKLRDAIEGHDTVDVATLSRDDCCALGKWIYGEGQRLASRPSFSELIERHKRFHQVAGQVGELVNRRAYREATDALAPGTPFSNATTDVVMVLSSAKRLGF